MPVVIPLAGLGTLVLVLWVIATAAAITDVILYIAGVIHGLPFPLNQLAGPIESLASGISRVCAKIEGEVDSWIGACWHLFAHYLDFMWHQFEAQAATVWNVANALVPISSFVHHIEGLAHHALHSIEAVLPRIRTLEKEWHGIEHRVKTLERDLTKGIGHDLRIQVAGLEHDVTHLENKVIPSIRSIADTAEADVTALQKWVADHALLVGTTALTGAVAWALSQIGLGGLRCPSLLRSLANRGCGLWQGLEDLLGLFIDALALSHLCDLPKWIEELFSPLLGDLTSLISSAANSVCAAANKSWANLDVPNGPLPPPQSLYLPDKFG